MAFNNGFPATYQPVYYPPQYQPMQYQMQPPAPPTAPAPQMQPVQNQRQIVQGGFVRVMNENEARMYPVAPGNSVTFIDESAPYCYTKTVDMSQLDRPKFERYRLVKEDDAPAALEGPNKPADKQPEDLSRFALAADLGAVAGEINAIKAEIETMRGDLYGIAGKKKVPAKKEAATDE